MLIFLLACASELTPITLDWYSEEIGDCDDDGTLEWEAPDDMVALSVRRTLDDDRIVWTDGYSVIADDSGDILFSCAPNARIRVTYALVSGVE